MTHRVIEVMGTVVSVDVREPDCGRSTLDDVEAFLRVVDNTFSTYRTNSWVSHLGRGEVTLDDCPQEVQLVMSLCAEVKRETDGWFDVMASGALDPSGLVKGWSLVQTMEILNDAGSLNACVNGGGDIIASGGPVDGRPWSIGIADPLQHGEVAAIVQGRDIAIATSGIFERGAHIYSPFSNSPAIDLASVTLVGRDLTRIDAYATACVAMGPQCRDWITQQHDLEGLVIELDGTTWQTRDFDRTWTDK